MQLLSLNTSNVRPLMVNGRKLMSGIGKQPRVGDVAVGPLGLDGDEQGDLSLHGGPSKAVYAYPAVHYAFWRTVRAQARVSLWDDALPYGLVGENLTLDGLAERDVWIGDVLRFPRCALAVSEPRFPCAKFNAVMGFDQAAKLMTQSGYCGFYLAVRDPGVLCAGETFELVPGPRDVSITELFKARARR